MASRNATKTGTLYLVGTPIGNLEDISLRALRILKEVPLIAAEDTRKTRRLLSRYQISTPLTSYYEHNKVSKLPRLLAALKSGDLALVSEAGMPGLSDPGFELINAAISRGINVVPLPGPSAVTTSLLVSGLPSDSFVYVGFLPRKKGDRHRLIASLAKEVRTIVAFEAPHRVRATLADIAEVLGDRRLAVCREMTKLHEEVFRGTADEALKHFREPKGEFTLVLEGGKPSQENGNKELLKGELERMQREGVAGREAVIRVSESLGISKNRVYRAWREVNSKI